MHMTLHADPGKLQRKKILISNLDLKLFLKAALQAWSCWVELVPLGLTHTFAFSSFLLVFPTLLTVCCVRVHFGRTLLPGPSRMVTVKDFPLCTSYTGIHGYHRVSSTFSLHTLVFLCVYSLS